MSVAIANKAVAIFISTVNHDSIGDEKVTRKSIEQMKIVHTERKIHV
jgi:hypothetical protein